MGVSSYERDSVEFCDADDAVHDELNRDRGEQQPHHAADSARARSSQPPEDPIRVVEQEVRDEDGDEDSAEDEQLVRGIRDGGSHVDHDRRDCTRAREERDAERHDGHLVALKRLFPLLLCEPRPGAFPAEHLERDAEEDDAPGYLERRDREAEPRENPLAEDREDAERDRRREARFRDDILLLRQGHVLREHGEERDHAERIYDRGDGGHGGGGERQVHHGLGSPGAGSVPSHQLHPAAAPVHGGIAAGRGPFALLPWGHPEPLASTRGPPQLILDRRPVVAAVGSGPPYPLERLVFSRLIPWGDALYSVGCTNRAVRPGLAVT